MSQTSNKMDPLDVAVNTPFPGFPFDADKIQSSTPTFLNNNSTPPFPSLSPVVARPLNNTTSFDYPVVTTESTQSTWRPSTASPSQQASTSQLQALNLPPHQRDFVLFDSPAPKPNRSVSQPSIPGGVTQQPQQQPILNSASASLQTQRVQNIIQATGHSISSSAFTNRLNPPQNQFYASSAPTSSLALNQYPQQQQRPPRPPVPLFTGTDTTGKMFFEDPSADGFTGFGGGASTAYSSPAMPTTFDFASASSGASNMGTVSPQDLFLQDPTMSAPNSTALTALTSPSVYNESPEFNEYDVSPNFGTADFDPNAGEWYPLFPAEETTRPLAAPALAEGSPAEQSEELDVPEAAPTRRNKSGNSPPSGRHSSVSGVSSRKRDKPLPPIIVEDPQDVVAMKRARNTLAARKSRERKAQRLDELEDQIAQLTQERDAWKKKAQALEQQRR